MRRGLVAALACVFGALGCTNASNTNPPLPPTGAGGVGPGIGGSTVPPPPPSGDVFVEIQEPMEGLVAPAGSLVDVRVHAYVDQSTGTDFIDTTSVEAVVTKLGDTAELESTQLAPELPGTDIFSGRISLGDRPTGEYTLTVSASSSGGHRGVSAPVNFSIDGGPLLLVTSPKPLHAYKGLLVIEVVADPGMFGPLEGPFAKVANYDVALTPVGDPANNVYRGTIDLRDPAPPMILPPLVNEQLLTVWAINVNRKRTEQHLVFFIDEEGPVISQTSPAPGQIVGDIMVISARVLDPSGVLDSSVVAVIGDDTRPAIFSIQLKPNGAGVYSSFFDTRKLTGCNDPPKQSDLCTVYPTISFRASDELGNERAIGYGFVTDNIAPVADLDPPLIRSYRQEEKLVCSFQFDPLGQNDLIGDMPNDGNRVAQVFDLRARIQDDGNHAVGLKVVPISGVDPDKTAVYVLDDESKALIVDTDGDGWCDSINPLLTPTTEPPMTNDQVLKVRLAPVPPAGIANFQQDLSLNTPFCRAGLDPFPPLALCPGNQPSIAIAYAGTLPAIWTVEHIDPANWCFGQQFDTFANNITEGWACIAVATSDDADNFSVSPPLRVDIEYKFSGAFGTAGRGTPPACTGTYDRVANTVTNGPCKTRRFERQPRIEDEWCYLRSCPGPFLPL